LPQVTGIAHYQLGASDLEIDMVSNIDRPLPNTLNASPAKSFFVEMLTRDIELEDAILDLLDNCIDGIQRLIQDRQTAETPYKDFWAKITFSKDRFEIEDNCGGIPLDIAESYAFRMGRPHNHANEFYTIGTYGIGMKRSIFKMGRAAEVISNTQEDSFKVTISPDWLSDDLNWDLPCEKVEKTLLQNEKTRQGTLIKVTNIHEHISREFSPDQATLENSLTHKISAHYSYIINKGFTILVNGTKVTQKPFYLRCEDIDRVNGNQKTIAPYLYQLSQQDVEVKLAIGFYREMASEDEVEDDIVGTRNRNGNETAGWTVICNDRVVLYCDKSRLTGWGEMTVPSYHPQFCSIAGVLYFRSKDVRKLPITTTKRGIDSSSDLYLYVKQFMREGLKIFTGYTNKWKSNLIQEKERSAKAQLVEPSQLFDQVQNEHWTKVQNRNHEKRYTPVLPSPEDTQLGHKKKKNIKFSRLSEEIETVSEYLFEDPDREAAEVGNECFEVILKQAEES
jgi:Histidine kinase-, DNA gyrase B-, and HSP90-like ATPase